MKDLELSGVHTALIGSGSALSGALMQWLKQSALDVGSAESRDEGPRQESLLVVDSGGCSPGSLPVDFATPIEVDYLDLFRDLSSPPSADSYSLEDSVEQLHVCVGQKVFPTDKGELFTKETVASLLGVSVQNSMLKSWSAWMSALEEHESKAGQRSEEDALVHAKRAPASLSKACKVQQKDACLRPLEALSGLLGIASPLEASLDVLTQRMRAIERQPLLLKWPTETKRLFDQAVSSGMHTSAMTYLAQPVKQAVWHSEGQSDGRRKGAWHISCEQDAAQWRADRLICADSPWASSSWLDESMMPKPVLQVVRRVQPVSAVTLTDKVQLPDQECFRQAWYGLMYNENVQLACTKQGDLVARVWLPYEHSLSAPNVLKAVRRLKRARDRWCKLYAIPDSCEVKSASVGVDQGRSERIILTPVAGPQSTAAKDQRWMSRLDAPQFSRPDLQFCGGAYGQGYQLSANLKTSTQALAF